MKLEKGRYIIEVKEPKTTQEQLGFFMPKDNEIEYLNWRKTRIFVIEKLK